MGARRTKAVIEPFRQKVVLKDELVCIRRGIAYGGAESSRRACPRQSPAFAVYNATSNSWQTLPNLLTGRNHLAACAIDGKIYVAGGGLGGGFTSPITNILEVFDPVLNQWSTRAPMTTPRGGINGIAAHGHFFVFGGEAASGVFDEMEMYVPPQDRWYRLEPLPTAVHGVTGAAFVNGWIYLPGGGTATGGSSGSTIHQVFWVEGIQP